MSQLPLEFIIIVKELQVTILKLILHSYHD